MLIKKADDKSKEIEVLKFLADRPDATVEIRKKVEQEIRNIQSGMKGEAEAAYEMEFHFGASKNWMILHDLRVECAGRVAQIDHLLINRFLEIYVCESKRFAEGVAVNEQGEFSAFHGGKAYGIASPLEQNKRHMLVLESVFKTGLVAPPTRLGFTIMPSLKSLVLVSKTARISRPKTTIDGVDLIIKNDQLRTRIERDIDKDNNILGAARIIGQETLADFARQLAAVHKPITFDWAAKFGLPVEPPAIAAVDKEVVRTTSPEPVQANAATDEGKKSKLICASCGAAVAYNIAKFCWFNKPRFGGKVFCFECQKSVPNP